MLLPVRACIPFVQSPRHARSPVIEFDRVTWTNCLKRFHHNFGHRNEYVICKTWWVGRYSKISNRHFLIISKSVVRYQRGHFCLYYFIIHTHICVCWTRAMWWNELLSCLCGTKRSKPCRNRNQVMQQNVRPGQYQLFPVMSYPYGMPLF
jgi:hypothetical protein